MSPTTYCRWCGQPSCTGACTAGFDAPAFCPVCGRRLVVKVHPRGYTARCAAHGSVEG